MYRKLNIQNATHKKIKIRLSGTFIFINVRNLKVQFDCPSAAFGQIALMLDGCKFLSVLNMRL